VNKHMATFQHYDLSLSV